MSRRRRGASARLPARELRREEDGTLYDVDEHRRMTLSQLRGEVQEGRRFRTIRHDGVDVTYEVLAEVVRSTPGLQIGPESGIVGALARAVTSGVFSAADHEREPRGVKERERRNDD